ncbi:hypothetical protein ES703_69660 [subsurface metagenome]
MNSKNGIPKSNIELLLDNACPDLHYVDAAFYCIRGNGRLSLDNVEYALEVCSMCKIQMITRALKTHILIKTDLKK